MNKNYFALFSLAVLGMAAVANSGATTAWADTTQPACSVAVCDIPAALQALRTGTENFRYTTIKGYRSNYKNTTDLAVLTNLADFAKQAVDVLKEVTAGNSAWDYLVSEAQGLYADVVMGLSKYSAPNGALLAGYYEQISNQDSRYAVLQYWHNRIKDFDTKDALLALLDFFGKAEAISKASGNADYIAREAHYAEDMITSRLVQLYPYFEGTYNLNVKCTAETGEDAPKFCKDGFIDRLVIMDTMSSAGIQVSLSNTKTGTMMYSFSNVELSVGGTNFDGQGSPSGVLSQIHVELDRASGKVTGYVRNSDSLTILQLEGVLDSTPAMVYDLQSRNPNPAPLAAAELTGLYKGKYAGHDVTFSLVQFGADQFGGTMSFDDQPTFKLRFQNSRFYSQLGILVFVANASSGAHVKLTAFFSKNKSGSGFTVQGFGFTDLSGATQDLNLVSVSGN